jgi:hypothetical protein
MKSGTIRIQKRSRRIPRLRAGTLRNVFTGAPRQLAVKDFCESYGVTQDTFTRLTGFSPRAVAHWANGDKPSSSTQRRLTEINRLFAALSELINKETIGPWLKQANSAFDGSTPLQVIERGESDRIWRMVSELESGEPG